MDIISYPIISLNDLTLVFKDSNADRSIYRSFYILISI